MVGFLVRCCPLEPVSYPKSGVTLVFVYYIYISHLLQSRPSRNKISYMFS